MSTQTALTVLTRGTANGAATANVTYNPVYASQRNENGFLVSVWQERTSTSPLGYSDLTVMSKPALGNVPMQRLNVRLVLPTLETLSTSSGSGYTAKPKVAYTNEVKIEALMPTQGTKEEKWELHSRAVSAFSNAVILALFKDNEQVS
jgi:hypothetical protein